MIFAFYKGYTLIFKIPEDDSDEDEYEFYTPFQHVEVIKVHVDLLTHERTLSIAMTIDGRDIVVDINRSDLIERKISRKLIPFGLEVNEKQEITLINVLKTTERYAKREYFHSLLGFHKVDEKLCYLCGNVIGNTKTKSVYEGEFDLKPKGSADGWKDLIKNYVIGDIELECALAIGFTAPVIAILIQNGVDIMNLMFNLVGMSSTGKTTAMRLMASIYGKPTKSDGGLISDYNSTKLALVHQLNDKYGFPVFFDEQTMVTQDNIDDFAYTVSNGKSKSALKSDGTVRQTKFCATSVISTSENSMFDIVSQNNGLKVRIFELCNQAWSKTAEIAETINEGIIKNYGWAVIDYVKYLLDIGTAEVERKYHEVRANIISIMKQSVTYTYNHLSERISKTIAVVVVSAEFANKSLGMSIDTDKLTEFLIDIQSKNTSSVDESDEAYQYVLDCIMSDQNYYNKCTENVKSGTNPNQAEIDVNAKGKIYGHLVYDKTGNKYVECWLKPDTLDKYFKQGRFKNVASIKEQWKNKGYLLKCDNKRYTTRKTLSKGVRETLYILNLDSDEASEDYDSENVVENTSDARNMAINIIKEAEEDDDE